MKSYFLNTLKSHSFFTQHEITAAGEKKHRVMSCQTNLQESSMRTQGYISLIKLNE